MTSVSPLDWKETSATKLSNVASAGSPTSLSLALAPLRTFSEFDPASILILPI